MMCLLNVYLVCNHATKCKKDGCKKRSAYTLRPECDDLAGLSMLVLTNRLRNELRDRQKFLEFCLASMEMDSLTEKLGVFSENQQNVLVLVKKSGVTCPAY